MPKSKRFQKGPDFRCMAELSDWLESGKPVYLREKYLTPGWAMSMQFKMLMDCVTARVIYRVIEVNNEREEA